MQPIAFTTALAHIRREEQIRTAREAHLPVGSPRAAGEVTIRSAGPGDVASLARLAQLDGRGQVVADNAILAVVAGEIVAARDLRGVAISDPFRAGEEVVALLGVRARQLAGARLRPAPRTARHARPVLRVGGAR